MRKEYDFSTALNNPYAAQPKKQFTKNAKKPALHRSLKSDLTRVDAHSVKADEYDDLPELDEAVLARAQVNRGGRPVASNLRKLLSIRLPADVIDRWKATGPGWQTRMAERLSSVR